MVQRISCHQTGVTGPADPVGTGESGSLTQAVTLVRLRKRCARYCRLPGRGFIGGLALLEARLVEFKVWAFSESVRTWPSAKPVGLASISIFTTSSVSSSLRLAKILSATSLKSTAIFLELSVLTPKNRS